MPVGTIGCTERFRFPGPRAKAGNGGMLTVVPMPTGTSTRKDLEIDDVAVTLRLAPTPMVSIDTAQ